ncbi:hypothetical protein [Candidatus Cardinium hertigii]|jgi:hypothetical protein|uniref:Uncharacterized protein n=1 Tax=Candidatus Cardinium hertigii TaxID=247481 RepID=A0A3N2QDS0_9BACT|nr:hypothetical protein [Candidatus Cardinium hertigii]ROT47809.1 hypothetical protein EDM02_00330 [Candidatus Cardinium hertigii]
MLVYKNKNICRGALLSFLTILGLTFSAGDCTPPKSQSEVKTKLIQQVTEGNRKCVTILRQKMLPKIKKNLNTETIKEIEKKINELDQAIEKLIAMTKDLTEEEIESGTGTGIAACIDQEKLIKEKGDELELIEVQILQTEPSKEVKDAISDAKKDIDDIINNSPKS